MNDTITHQRPRRLRPPRRSPPHAPARWGHGMTGFEVRRSTREPLIALSVSLADEFSDRVPAGTVIRSVAQAREGLLAAGVRAGLVVAVESMTRARLHALAASSGSASSDDVARMAGQPSSCPIPARRYRNVRPEPLPREHGNRAR